MNSDKEVDVLFLKSIQNVNLSGKTLPEKLRFLMWGKPRKTISALSNKYSLSKEIFSKVIKGIKKSKRIESILQDEWGLSLSEIREIILEHIQRLESGNPISDEELYVWRNIHTSKMNGMEPEFGIQMLKHLDGLSSGGAGIIFAPLYYIRKQKRDWYYRNRKRSVA
ncbi:MAG: hypothetical protein HS129_15205 [Leptospiraceae bacterium]|nr:hypothetical protein [Leptospiraceae bacterium]NUM40837.1 hypothetical protein [Leptospiraceae bacterium]